MNDMDLAQRRVAIEAELLDAQESRDKAKEGRARVCARRAAGLAIGMYYEKHIGHSPIQNAYKLLQWFSRREEIPEYLQQAARRLTVRVTPAYDLPHQEDPIEDARLIVTAILNGRI
jgi:hypothetical protein